MSFPEADAAPAGQWVAVDTEDSHFHIVPARDAVTHEESDGCVCGPSVELARRSPDMYIVTHHSLDGREQHEN